MIVSASNIHFKGCENLHTITLENTTDHSLIFKMKITHTDLFAIAPGKGLLLPLQKLPVTVKLNRITDCNAKLLVSYAQLAAVCEQQRGSIDQQWAKIDKQHHQNIIIPITRTSYKQPQQKKQERQMFKKTESPIYQAEIRQEEQQESSDNNSRRPEPLIKKSLTLKSSSNMFRSVEDLDKRDTGLKENALSKLQKELEEQRQKNKRMGERLIEKEKKILYLNEMRQLQINKSLNQPQEAQCGWGNTLLATFLLLMIGFMMSKYDLPYDFSA